MATLRDAKVGETVTVKKLTGEGAVKRRIMDMRSVIRRLTLKVMMHAVKSQSFLLLFQADR